jgi:endonuclease/exonuclease/phosphatase family metal-dependent hydrolase
MTETAPGPSPAVSTRQVLRLMTMNIWGVNGDWPARRRYLTDGIHELGPDVLTLQETVVDDSFDQVRELLGPEYAISHSSARAPDGMGISIASRYPVRSVSEADLQINDRTADFPCTALLAVIDSPIGELLLINHFPSWKLDMEAERLEQALHVTRAAERIMPELDRPVIIAGDLDADPDAASIRYLTGREPLAGSSVCYRDAWDSRHHGEPGHTYTTDNPMMIEDWPFRRIDYVLVRCAEHGGPSLDIADCRRIFDAADDDRIWASDHFGLVADLVPNPLATAPHRSPSHHRHSRRVHS